MPAPRDPATEKNWLNIAALVASLTTPVTGIGWLVGIVFGHLGVGAAKRGEANNKGFGVAGLIIGYVLGALGALVLFVVFLGPLIALTWAGIECSGADQPDWCTSSTYEYEYNGG